MTCPENSPCGCERAARGCIIGVVFYPAFAGVTERR